MIESAARGVQFLLAIGIAYVVALWFAVVAWTFRDIESRSRSVFTQVFSTLLVVLFFIPGLLLYLILRPKETIDQAFQRALEEEYLLQDLDDLPLCPGCQRSVDADFVLCPHCQTTLRGPCPSCARLVDVRWKVCPFCASSTDALVAINTAQPSASTLTTDAIRVLDSGQNGRRQRAVAAAAERVGIAPDELDAFTDALSGSPGHPAVSAGTSSGGLTRRFTAFGDAIRPRAVRPDEPSDGERDPSERFRPGRDNGPSHQIAATKAGDGPAPTVSFWEDPLPGADRERDRNGGGSS